MRVSPEIGDSRSRAYLTEFVPYDGRTYYKPESRLTTAFTMRAARRAAVKLTPLPNENRTAQSAFSTPILTSAVGGVAEPAEQAEPTEQHTPAQDSATVSLPPFTPPKITDAISSVFCVVSTALP